MVNYVNLGHVGYGNVPGFSAHTDGKFGFKCRFIKTREGSSSMCRLKLSGCQHPVGRKIIILKKSSLHIQSNLWTINLELKLKHQCCGCLTWPLHCLWYICLYKSHENCLISWRRTPNAPHGFLSQMWSHQKRVRSVHRLQTHWFADPEDVWSPRAELWRSAGSCCEGWRLWCPALPLWGSGRLRWRSGRSSWGVSGGHSAGVSRFLAILSYPREKATHLCLCWQSLHGCQQKDHRIKLQM